MCPSYKATRDRRHSPKGRASLTREWLRQLAALGIDPESEAAALRRGSAWRHFPARLRNTWAGGAGLLACGERGDGWMPRLQILQRAVSDQG